MVKDEDEPHPPIRPSAAFVEFAMPEDSNLIPSTRLARWLLLLVLVVAGVVLYFRSGTRLARFGSVEPATAVDTSR